MRVLALVALAACGGASVAPKPPSASAAPTREPILVYTLETKPGGEFQTRWVSADGTAGGAISDDFARPLRQLRSPVQTAQGTWFVGRIDDGGGTTQPVLVLARRTATGVSLSRVETPSDATIAPGGTMALVQCTDGTSVCLAPLSPSHLGAPRPLPGYLDRDRVLGWRGTEVVVAWHPMRTPPGQPAGPTVSIEDPSAFAVAALDPITGRRRQLGELTGGEWIGADASGTTFLTVSHTYTLVRVRTLERPDDGFSASTPPGQGWALDRWRLPTPTVLLTSEREQTGGASLVAFTRLGKTVLAKPLVDYVASADRVAFTDGVELATSNFAGEHRAVLAVIPKGTRAILAGWLP